MTQAEVNALLQSIRGGALTDSVANAVKTVTADGAIPTDRDGTYLIAKTSVAAMTVAAPTAAMVGRRITIVTATDFAHVTTFTGTTLWDGTAGANSTATATAVKGNAITFVCAGLNTWLVESSIGMTIAP